MKHDFNTFLVSVIVLEDKIINNALKIPSNKDKNDFFVNF